MSTIGRGIAGPVVTGLCLPEPVRRDIAVRMHRDAPLECCGLLAGRVEGARALVTAHFPGANLAPEPGTSFEIDPALLFETQRAVRARGEHVLGHYHSHPNGKAEPSQTDRRQAWVPGHVWLIAAPAPGGGNAAFGACLAVEQQGCIVLRPLEILDL